MKIAYNNTLQPTHLRGVSFVADATSLTPLRRSAELERYINKEKVGKTMKYAIVITLILSCFKSAFADPPDPIPVLLFDNDYALYEVHGNFMLGTAGACIDDIVGVKVIVWDRKGNAHPGRVGPCIVIPETYKHTHKVDIDQPSVKRIPYGGVVIVKPQVKSAHISKETSSGNAIKAISHSDNIFPVIEERWPKDEEVGKELLRVRKSFGSYVNYDIECWVQGDWDYGYYDVCSDSENSGSYLFSIESGHSVRITKGLPIRIRWVFEADDELIVIGSAQFGKSGGANQAYLIKDNKSKLIFQSQEEGS